MKSRNRSVATAFFTLDEQQKISHTVHQAEARTSGELVPMVVGESHSYPMASVRGAALLALILAILLTSPVASMFWLGNSNMWIFLSLFFPLYWSLSLVIEGVPWIKRQFLFSDEKETEVRKGAFAAFFEEGLYKTKEANGILIYISLLEHRAWILADSGINDRIAQETWDEALALVTAGLKEDKACDALCRAIAMIGDILATEFPVQSDDQNELHDLIIR